MKTIYTTQVKTICEADSRVFDVLFNQAMKDLKDNNPMYELDTSKSFFCAHIFFDVKDEIPEGAEDIWELAGGEISTCKECKYFLAPADKRMKNGFCKLHKDVFHEDGRCCEEYYIEQLERKVEGK